MKNAGTDGPQRLLAAAIRLLPNERRGWGLAMLAELGQLQHPSTRWRFALGCARVAIFPPRKGGLSQTIMEQTQKSVIKTLGLAILISFLLVLPFPILQVVYSQLSLRKSDNFVLFGLLWLLSMAFIVSVIPIVRTIRMGNSLLANPITLLLRVAFLALLAWMWGVIIIDQLPCFLGVPNCD